MWPCKSRAGVAVVTAVLLCVAARAGADQQPLDLVWVDPTGVAAGVYDTLALESRTALAPIGADVSWMEAPPGAVLGPQSLAVIAIPSSPRTSVSERHVMGATRTSDDGAIAVWVFPDQVAWALGLDLQMRRSWGRMKEHDFARALARVASHEVLHAIGVIDHVPGGLMSSHLDRQALVGAPLRVDRSTVAEARRALGGGSSRAAGGAHSFGRGGTPAPLLADLPGLGGPRH